VGLLKIDQRPATRDVYGGESMKLLFISTLTALITAALTVLFVLGIFILPSIAWWEKLLTDPNATFAAAVAAFTLGLVVVGYLQVSVTRLQYRATVALEAPVFRFGQIKLVEYANKSSMVALGDRVAKGTPPAFSRILVLLANAGRSNAQVDQACVEWFVGLSLPDTPRYQHIQNWNMILPPNAQSWALFDEFGDVELTPAECAAINARSSYLWTYGFFSYSDFKGDRFTHGFLGRWDIDHGFVREFNQKYEYQLEVRP
jgi:hypothetical protein